MIHYLLTSAGMSREEADRYINGSTEEKERPLAVLQGKSARFAMQTLGTEWRDFLGKDLWTDITRSKVESTPAVVITDMRFLHEASFVESYGGMKVRVLRPGTGDSGDNHQSEIEMESITEDYKIFNHGSLVHLRDAVAYIMGDAR
jgi:hypothetical protein